MKKLAIALCAHHKPWLLMSTLISLAMQDYRDFDLYFLNQAGDGSCLQKPSYAEYFRLAERYGAFVQLSSCDQRVKEIFAKTGFKQRFFLEFENDHSLDSGAWYKFIKTGLWRKYDFLLFIQEGGLFTGEKVISSALDFAARNSIGFISSGHEKRRLPREVALNCNKRKRDSGDMDAYHDTKLKEVFDVFCRDIKFKNIFDSWGSDFEIETQNHVPDILDPLWMKVLRSIKRRNMDFLLGRSVYVNTRKMALKEAAGDFYSNNGVIFHKDNRPEWFGCSCQHLLSAGFIESFVRKIEQSSLYDVLEIPFCAGALEIIWGFLPNWLGFDKWFFNGIHRVRKSFLDYKREDFPERMAFYLNRYFGNKLSVVSHGDFLKIKRMNKEFSYLNGLLGRDFFLEGVE